MQEQKQRVWGSSAHWHENHSFLSLLPYCPGPPAPGQTTHRDQARPVKTANKMPQSIFSAVRA